MPKVDIQWKAHRDGDGRGILTTTGDIYVWPEEEMTHSCKARELGLDFEDLRCFYIGVKMHPTKMRYLPPGYLNLYELDDEQGAQVLAAIPTLDPPPRWNGSRVAPSRVAA